MERLKDLRQNFVCEELWEWFFIRPKCWAHCYVWLAGLERLREPTFTCCRSADLSKSIIIYAIRRSLSCVADWSGANDHERVQRQLSVSSDSKLLDDDIREETKVIMRPKKPPRPKSEVFLNKQDPLARRKRFSAFGVSWFEVYLNRSGSGFVWFGLLKQALLRFKCV